MNFICRILCLFGKHKWCYGLNSEGQLDYEEGDNERRFCIYCGKEEIKNTNWTDL